MNREERDYHFKLVLAGAPQTGKEAIAIRFSRDQFPFDYSPTIGVEFYARFLKLKGVKCKVTTWTLSGQERFANVVKSYVGGASGVMIVFDITNHQSFDKAKYWLELCRSQANCSMQLVGNKKDKENERKVSQETAISFAAQHGMEYIEVSALDGTNIEEACLQAIYNSPVFCTP